MSVFRSEGRNDAAGSLRPAKAGGFRDLAVVLLKLVVSALVLWLLVRSLDLDKLRAVLHHVDPWLVGVAVALLATVPMISAPRWRAILVRLGQTLRFGPLTRALYVGSFLSQVLPSSIGGDLWRIWFCTRAGAPLGVAINSVLIERLAGLAATILFFVAAFPLLSAKVGQSPIAWATWAILVVCVAGAAILIAIAVAPVIVPASPLWAPLSSLALSLATVLRSNRLVWLMLVSAMLGQAVAIVAVFTLAHGLALPLSLLDCAVTLPPALLISLMPVSLGGWGVREGAFVMILGCYGIPSEEALVLSVLFGLALLASTLPGLVVWLSPRTVRECAMRSSEGAASKTSQ